MYGHRAQNKAIHRMLQSIYAAIKLNLVQLNGVQYQLETMPGNSGVELRLFLDVEDFQGYKSHSYVQVYFNREEWHKNWPDVFGCQDGTEVCGDFDAIVALIQARISVGKRELFDFAMTSLAKMKG